MHSRNGQLRHNHVAHRLDQVAQNSCDWPFPWTTTNAPVTGWGAAGAGWPSGSASYPAGSCQRALVLNPRANACPSRLRIRPASLAELPVVLLPLLWHLDPIVDASTSGEGSPDASSAGSSEDDSDSLSTSRWNHLIDSGRVRLRTAQRPSTELGRPKPGEPGDTSAAITAASNSRQSTPPQPAGHLVQHRAI